MSLPNLLKQFGNRALKNLRTLPQLLLATPVRSMVYPATQTQYFSAVDICHLLCNPLGTVQTPQSLKRAKSYWQYLKRTDARFQMSQGSVGVQLSLPDRHGRFRLTDVIDVDTVLYLIKKIAHQHSRVFKLWLCWMGVRQIVRMVLGWVVRWVAQVVRLARLRGKRFCVAFSYMGERFAIG